MNIEELRYVHFSGIKGVGMAGLALCCKDLGIKVTGSDVDEYFVTDETLKKRDIDWDIGFNKQNFNEKPDLLVATAAHGGLNNPEVLKAKKLGITVITYAEALAVFTKSKKLINVCGVGGKSTTSSMLSVLFEHAKYNPSFVVGVADIFPILTPARYRKNGEYFICEADEYAISPGIDDNAKFTLLNPFITVVTNIEHDHPDIYPTFADTRKTFRKYFERIPKEGLLVACVDNTNVERMVPELGVPVATYGFNTKADYVISDIKYGKQTTHFVIKGKETKEEVTMKLPGMYNIQNATAAYICAKHIGMKTEMILEGLKAYEGCKRRFEFMGDKGGILYYDDYAHHPEEVKSLLKAFRDWATDKRIVAIFQPHTYSRTKILLDDFAESFMDSDLVAFMDIYASAREKVDKTIDSKILSKKVELKGKEVAYTGSEEDTLNWIKENAKQGDIVVTIGAGDIFQLHKKIQ
jgi:UDP-N-acetylmuramate--alanine ligase